MADAIKKIDSTMQNLLNAVSEQVSAMQGDSTSAQQLLQDGTVAYVAQSYETFKDAMDGWAQDFQSLMNQVDVIAGDLGIGSHIIDRAEGQAGSVATHTFTALTPGQPT